MGFALSLVPVLAFLVILVALDSFKLVSPRHVVTTILFGGLVAGTCYLANTALASATQASPAMLYRYIAPAVEETAKAGVVVYLIMIGRTGFVVDSAIYGFAVGAGFAVVENIYYVNSLLEASAFTWVVRGFGTAIMHGGATAIYAIVAKTLTEGSDRMLAPLLPGLAVAFVIHSLFNHLVVPPIVSTALLLVTLPLLMIIVFHQGEKHTREWLGVGFDSDQELLELIKSGNISGTRVGQYLKVLQERFEGKVIADMLCWLRIQVELSIKAKGIMLMREAGFKTPPDPATRAKLEELAYLEESIGRTGLLAISPVVRATRRDVWQMQLLDGN
jgi:RsiW-degrading membrane proteinase PrsW (M82 family)